MRPTRHCRPRREICRTAHAPPPGPASLRSAQARGGSPSKNVLEVADAEAADEKSTEDKLRHVGAPLDALGLVLPCELICRHKPLEQAAQRRVEDGREKGKQ